MTPLRVLLALSLGVLRTALAKIGFCLNVVPPELQGTGFAEVSPLSESACKQAHGAKSWCPLDSRTDTWEVGGKSIEYYWFSPCCNGRQGETLFVDSTSGFPTCFKGKMASQCTRSEWVQKVSEDLGVVVNRWPRGHPYFYDYQVGPSTLKPMDATRIGGLQDAPSCSCKPESAKCLNISDDGNTCLLCTGISEACSDFQVQLSIHFFKLHTVDLKSSLLAFQAWIRQIWHDIRLSYDFQCYGGLEGFEVLADPGGLENSRLWTPDIELYNNEESLWNRQGTRLATVYSCWDAKPSRGGCGHVWFSRPGLLKALCKYDGLVLFPRDELTCELEFAAWGVDGRWQDIIPRKKDGGFNYAGRPDLNTMAGITGGSSYQDYKIKKVGVRRDIVTFDCCPNAPWPTLVYTLTFARSTSYYEMKLFMPAFTLTALTFFAFWMDPASGERLSFGITLILAVVMNDVVASQMMPVCAERLLMDYVSIVCFIFAVMSLVESLIVVHLYHREDPSLLHVMTPRCLQKMRYRWKKRKRHGTRMAQLQNMSDTPDDLAKYSMYKQVFHVLDKDMSGELDVWEMEAFGVCLAGPNWKAAMFNTFLDAMDLNNDGKISFPEFAYLCEQTLDDQFQNAGYLDKMIRNFIKTNDRIQHANCKHWKARAAMVDGFARVVVPIAFIISVTSIFSSTQAELEDIMWPHTVARQWLLMLRGLIPAAVCLVLYIIYILYNIYDRWRSHRRWEESSLMQVKRGSQKGVDGFAEIVAMENAYDGDKSTATEWIGAAGLVPTDAGGNGEGNADGQWTVVERPTCDIVDENADVIITPRSGSENPVPRAGLPPKTMGEHGEKHGTQAKDVRLV